MIATLSLMFYFAYQQTADAYEVLRAKTIGAGKPYVVRGVDMAESYEDFSDVEEDVFDQSIIKEEHTKQVQQDTLEDKIRNFFEKRKKNKNSEQELDEEDINEEISESDENIDLEKPYQLQTKLPEEKVIVEEKNKFQINADNVMYDDESGNVFAKGNVVINAREQGVILKAQNAVLDKNNQTLTLTDDVKIYKGAAVMRGESMVVDLNEQNILMDNPTMDAYSFSITAQEGFLIENDIQMLNGSMRSARDKQFPIITRGFMRLDNIASKNPFRGAYEFPESENDTEKEKSYRIEAKEIVVTTYKDHNSVLLKKSNVYYNNHKVIRNSDLEIISDKTRQIVETSLPEAGNLRNFGTFVGFGFVNKIPNGDTLKLMPVLAYSDSNAGVGLIARYRARNGMVVGGWNTASENLVVRGRYNLANNLLFTFGRHAYMPEGFMGARRSGYAAQLMYAKSYSLPDLKANFNNAFYAGLFSDYQKEHQEDAYSTTRFRYMAQLSKKMYEYKNEEQDFGLVLSGAVQGAATVYGSGENHGIVRIGPTLTTRYKRWESRIGYMISGTHGETPFRFDRYRYGKSTITLSEKFIINEKLAFGFRLFVTPMKDNPEEDLFTECRFFVMAGPKDAKLAFSYDFVRDVSHLDVMFLLGSKNTRIDFDKLTTNDIENKAKKRDFYKNAKRVKIINPENI